MPEIQKNKAKLIELLRILEERTDDEHSLTVAEIISELSTSGIKAERKAIYQDIELLNDLGYDIVCHKDPANNYCLVSRDFELAELKLLVDVVQATRFITEEKSSKLIKKLEGQASMHQAKKLQRHVYIQGRVKTENEGIFYNVDKLHQAISDMKPVCFRYFNYDINRKKVYRNEEESGYCVFPVGMTWQDENYYLIAYHKKYNGLSNFRVDRMEKIEIAEDLRATHLMEEMPENMKRPDVPTYVRKHFSMFSGEDETVTLLAENSLITTILDKFGHDTTLRAYGDTQFTARIHITDSPTFLSWVFIFGGKIKLIDPPSMVDKMKVHIKEVMGQYQM